MPKNTFTRAQHILVTAIRPALHALGKGGLAAEQLVLGTGMQESLLVHRRQLGQGPARGLFQMEPATHDDCWTHFLRFHDALADQVRQTLETGQHPSAAMLEVNDCYAAAMCRIHYLRVTAALPAANDIPAMAHYWKRYYNTVLGAGTPEEFLKKWPRYVTATTFD